MHYIYYFNWHLVGDSEKEKKIRERGAESRKDALLFNKIAESEMQRVQSIRRQKKCLRLHKERKRTNGVSFKIITHEQNMCFRLCMKKARPFNAIAQVGFRVCCKF